MHDIIVVGGGPAGLTAALYALRNGKSALVIEKSGFGGQITHSPKVENYPGTLEMSGNEFADRLVDQILRQGAEIEVCEAVRVEREGETWKVTTDDGQCLEGRAVILATGVNHRTLGLEGEEELVGDGVSYCAVCDGEFFRGKRVCVAGGGSSGLQEALLLSGFCREVTVLQDLPALTGEERLQKAIQGKRNVKVRCGIRIRELLQENERLTGLRVQEGEGDIEEIECDGLFVAIGLTPENEAFASLADLTPDGYFDSDENCRTKTSGIYVAGDCRKKDVRQLATAIADGACAALRACQDLDARD